MPSVPFMIFPSSPLLVLDILIFLAVAVFFIAYRKYFNSPLNRELEEKERP